MAKSKSVALVAPNGTRVTVDESKVEARLRGGYRRPVEEKQPASRRGRKSE